MKKFEITFTNDTASGIYSANLVHATSEEQATAYYTAQGYTVAGCRETTSDPKPGQPVTVIPEDWEISEEEEETARTIKEITADIIEFFENNDDIFTDCIEELDSYNDYLGDDRYYLMEELDEFYNDVEPSEILRRAYYGHDAETYTTDASGNKEYGEFNPNRHYFTYNGYGNLVSADYKDYSAHLDRYAVEAMSENRHYIDTLFNNDELCTLFDELETVEE